MNRYNVSQPARTGEAFTRDRSPPTSKVKAEAGSTARDDGKPQMRKSNVGRTPEFSARYCRDVIHGELKHDFDREQLASALRDSLPHLGEDSSISPTRGGRTAATEALAQIKPQAYGGSRNFLSGDVTRLSAYLRHGVLTLAEVRDYALERVDDPAHAGKLINELAWRDYWQRLYVELGEAIWQDREPYKTGYAVEDYADMLPQEIRSANTTLVCMDSFTRDLEQTGYLHNHARLWFASYIVHWRRIRWQTGARWFLEHLIDGDPASNNLSWQWVASTFASAPYFFNRENLERYTEGAYCKVCPHAETGTCPFDQSYEALQDQLFPRLDSYAGQGAPLPPRPYASPTEKAPAQQPQGKPLLWHHTDSLNPTSSALASYTEAPAVFIWDTGWLVANQISLKRVMFIAECLQEMPGKIEVRAGDPSEQLLAAAQSAEASYILAQRTPDPRLNAAAAQVQRHLPVVWFEPPAFVENSRGFDLKRFSRYWKRAQDSAMQPTPLLPLQISQK